MTHSIDVAWFECINCGHRSTAPEAINSIPNRMEVLEVYRGRIVDDPQAEDGKRVELPTITNEAAHKAQLEAKYQGNTIIIRNEGVDRVVRLARSHCKAEHDKTELAESDHITLKCPQCDTVLYDVDFRKRRRP